MEHLEVDLPATEASEEEVERNNVEEDVAGDKVERGVKSVKPIGAEIWAGKVLELVLEVASRQIRLAPAWVWHELCKIFDTNCEHLQASPLNSPPGRPRLATILFVSI